MDDSDNRDTRHIENIIEFLKEGNYVNTFILVRYAQNIRMSHSFKSMLNIFELVFGKMFWNYVVLCHHVHTPYSDIGAKVRENIDIWKTTIQNNFPKSKET